MNAADYFTNATPGNHKPFSNVNHFGGSLGGPIIHDKLFFFFDSEWVRIALPIYSTITVPTPAFQQYVLQQLPLGGTDAITGVHYSPAPATGAVLSEDVFAVWQHQRHAVGGSGMSVQCRMETRPQARRRTAMAAPIAWVSRIPATIMSRCRLPASITTSTRTTPHGFAFRPIPDCRLPRPIPSIRSSIPISPQPLYSFAAGYTHIFSQNLVNYFNPAFSWYSSIFAPSNLQATLAAFPIVLQGAGANAPFTTIGGLDNTWPQGRRATRFFINDNLAWSHGAHEFRFGTNTRIFRLNDFDFGEGTVPTVNYTDLPQFIYGVASTATQTFPQSPNEPFNFLNIDLYAQDTWRVTPTFTWTFGLRGTYNSNPLNPHDQVARLTGSFDSISHDLNQPLNAGDSDQSRSPVQLDAFRDSSAANGDCLAIPAKLRVARRLRRLQRPSAGKRCRPDRNQSTVCPNISGWSAGNGGRDCDCAGRAQQRHRCAACSEPEFCSGIRTGRVVVRFSAG